MPFPFLWVGALVATAFLAVVVTTFGVLLKMTGWAATEVRESILPGLIAGIRDWADDRRLPAKAISSPPTGEAGPQLEEVPSSDRQYEELWP